MTDTAKPDRTPGQVLVDKVYKLCNELSEQMIKEKNLRPGVMSDQVVVLLAAALLARTVLDARQKHVQLGDLLAEQVAVERGLCLQIITGMKVDELMGMISESYVDEPAPAAPEVLH